MRPLRRHDAPPAGGAPAAADAGQQAAQVAGLRRGGGKAVLALGLTALVVGAVLVLARAAEDGNILALGSSPKSSTIPPLADGDPINGDPLYEGSQVIAPGDPSFPIAGPVAGQAAATGAVDPVTAAVAARQAAAAGAGLLDGSGGGAASGGIPIPTTRAGSGGGGGGTTTPTTTGGGAPGTTTTIPGQPPPPPTCSVSEASVDPSRVGRKGQSGKLDTNLKVQFRPTSACGTGYRVQVNGLDVAAGAGPGGLFVATIAGDTANWGPGSYSITVKSSNGSTIAAVPLTVT